MLNDEYMHIIYHLCERIRILSFGILQRALFGHFFLHFFLTIFGSITPYVPPAGNFNLEFLCWMMNIWILVIICVKEWEFYLLAFFWQPFSSIFFHFFRQFWIKMLLFPPAGDFNLEFWCWLMNIWILAIICVKE
jgi:hypothetical protein